ncbi:hypothetical protein V6Z94_005669 [Aspergillus fumigatus]
MNNNPSSHSQPFLRSFSSALQRTYPCSQNEAIVHTPRRVWGTRPESPPPSPHSQQQHPRLRTHNGHRIRSAGQALDLSINLLHQYLLREWALRLVPQRRLLRQLLLQLWRELLRNRVHAPWRGLLRRPGVLSLRRAMHDRQRETGLLSQWGLLQGGHRELLHGERVYHDVRYDDLYRGKVQMVFMDSDLDVLGDVLHVLYPVDGFDSHIDGHDYLDDCLGESDGQLGRFELVYAAVGDNELLYTCRCDESGDPDGCDGGQHTDDRVGG